VKENLRGLRENFKYKILKIVQPHETPPSAMRWLHNGDALPTNDDRITLSSAWNPKVTLFFGLDNFFYILIYKLILFRKCIFYSISSNNLNRNTTVK
jgi:hypothetical protein